MEKIPFFRLTPKSRRCIGSNGTSLTIFKYSRSSKTDGKWWCCAKIVSLKDSFVLISPINLPNPVHLAQPLRSDEWPFTHRIMTLAGASQIKAAIFT